MQWRFTLLVLLWGELSACAPLRSAEVEGEEDLSLKQDRSWLDCRDADRPQPGWSYAGESVLDRKDADVALYIIGDLQGAVQPWMASLIAAGLIEVDYEGYPISARQALRLKTPIPIEALDIRWARKQGKALLVQMGDLIHGDHDALGDAASPAAASLMPAGRWTVDNVGIVAFAEKLEKVAREAGSESIVLMGNHDYAFLTQPQLKPFTTFAEGRGPHAFGAEQICSTLFGGKAELATFLRRLPVALRVNDVFLSHTGYTGILDRGEVCAPQAGGDLNDFGAYVQQSLKRLPDVATELIDHNPNARRFPESLVGGVLTEAFWWRREASSPARRGLRALFGTPGWLERYFRELRVHHIVMGHVSKPFSRKESEERIICGKQVAGGEKDRYTVYKSDVRYVRWQEQTPTHWMLACTQWSRNLTFFGRPQCLEFQRMKLVDPQGEPAALREAGDTELQAFWEKVEVLAADPPITTP